MSDYETRHFWAKVNKDGPAPAHAPELGGCWIWEGNRNRLGYGMYAGISNGKGRGKKRRAHRISWELARGATELMILHKCDTPSCVNPDHLFAGTQVDNIRDMRAKGRAVNPPLKRGESNAQAKLNDSAVQKMRDLYRSGVTQFEIGELFGVNQTTVSNIVLGRTWRHLGGEPIRRAPNLDSRSGENNRNAKMTPEKVCKLRAEYAAGAGFAELGRSYGVSLTTAKSIAIRRTWKQVA